jgi:hypothetical protein
MEEASCFRGVSRIAFPRSFESEAASNASNTRNRYRNTPLSY